MWYMLETKATIRHIVFVSVPSDLTFVTKQKAYTAQRKIIWSKCHSLLDLYYWAMYTIICVWNKYNIYLQRFGHGQKWGYSRIKIDEFQSN